MTPGFIGRATELALLDKRYALVASTGTGSAVAIRGRRQVGKSRLVQEFCDRAGAPYLFFAATKGASPVESVAAWTGAIRESTLRVDRDLIPDVTGGDWPDAFRLLATAVGDQPTIVVIDEVPWLAEQDPIFDGALQTAWDRLLSRKPVLLLLLGSDIHMMERLTAYDRPFYGRADNLILGPLNPAETGRATGLSGADAIDAYLMSGGLPGILRSWPTGTTAMDHVRAECADPASPVFGVPEAALMAEFPLPDQSRRVLEAVGSGDRTHAGIATSAGSRSGPLPAGTLSPLLRRLVVEKRVLAIEEPLSTKASRPALYRVADPSLRFYLAAGRRAHEHARRGRPDAGYDVIARQWQSWRGRAVEPVVREALANAAAAGALPWPDVGIVGGWWNRRFDPEVDLVGADHGPVANRIAFAGSIKWLDAPFDPHHLSDLRRGVVSIPGFRPGSSGLAIVTASGTTSRLDLHGVDLVWGPDDIVGAWAAS
jgi:uncharacterized protein